LFSLNRGIIEDLAQIQMGTMEIRNDLNVVNKDTSICQELRELKEPMTFGISPFQLVVNRFFGVFTLTLENELLFVSSSEVEVEKQILYWKAFQKVKTDTESHANVAKYQRFQSMLLGGDDQKWDAFMEMKQLLLKQLRSHSAPPSEEKVKNKTHEIFQKIKAGETIDTKVTRKEKEMEEWRIRSVIDLELNKLIIKQTIKERKDVDISVTKALENLPDVIEQGEDVMISTMVRLALCPTEEELIHKSYLDDILGIVNV
jgi:hypothetical protein